MNTFARLGVSLSLALGLAADVSANLVSNGSFETFTGVFGGDGGAQLVPVSTTLTGWTIVGGEVAVLKTPNSYSLTASDGNNFMDLAGYTNTGFPKGLSQTLTGLSAGQTYTFSMALGILNGNCGSVGPICHGPIEVSGSVGSTSQTFTHNSALPGNIWGSYGFDFVATDSTMTLTILGVSLPLRNAYIGLDDVSVVAANAPVPEPETYALMLVGLALLGAATRRSRR